MQIKRLMHLIQQKLFNIGKNRRMILKRTILYSSLTFLILAVSFFIYVYMQGPPPLANEQNTVIYSAENEVIGVKHGSQNRYWVRLNEVSPYVKKAFIATEDKHFYSHFGFDIPRIAIAASKNILSMEKLQGASTITQQYARNLYLSHEKTWKRKLNEAIYALRLEMFYDKDEILEGYLNTIYFGHGNYGIEAASGYYFNKHASELNLAEAALLTAIPKGPSYYSPINHPKRAKKRQEVILKLMLEEDIISKTEYKEALNSELVFSLEDDRKGEQIAPYFQDIVMEEATEILDKTRQEIESGGYKIYTTLNSSMQEDLEKTVEKTMDKDSSVQIAAISLDPKSGGIRALMGGRNYVESPFNRAIHAKRMAGSTFKPILYYAALKMGYTPATALQSRPTQFELADGQVYAPSNYNGYYAYDTITLAQALALSDNIYAVKTNMFFKPQVLVDTARQFGITSELPAVPSLALGTASVTVLEMTKSYAVLANNGKDVTPHTITKIMDSRGQTIYERKKEKKQLLLDPKIAFVLTHLMTGIFDESLNDYSQVTGASISDILTRPYAAKTGSTNTDSWMIGFSPQLVTAIWTGYDKDKSLTKAKEIRYAREIWAHYMEKVHQPLTYQDFKPPKGVKGVYMDPHTGKLANEGCPDARLTYFIEGTEPTDYCTLHFPEEKLEGDPKENDGNSIWDWIF
jgi:penicillin-binding protein 2D